MDGLVLLLTLLAAPIVIALLLWAHCASRARGAHNDEAKAIPEPAGKMAGGSDRDLIAKLWRVP